MKSCFVKRLSSSWGLWPPTGLFYMPLCSLWRGHSGRTPWMDNFAWWWTKLLYWTILKIFHLRIIWITERRICRKRMQTGFHYGHLLDSGLFSSSTYVSLLLEKGDKYRQENNNVPSYIDCDSIFFSKFYEIKKRPQNIIGLRMQTIYGISLMANVLVFHLVKIFILQSDNSSSKATFTLWIQGMILDNLGRYKRYRETFIVIAQHVCVQCRG